MNVQNGASHPAGLIARFPVSITALPRPSERHSRFFFHSFFRKTHFQYLPGDTQTKSKVMVLVEYGPGSFYCLLPGPESVLIGSRRTCSLCHSCLDGVLVGFRGSPDGRYRPTSHHIIPPNECGQCVRYHQTLWSPLHFSVSWRIPAGKRNGKMLAA